MPRKKLTSLFVENVRVTQRTEFQDETVRGLCLRVSPSGTKSWYLRYVRRADGAKPRLAIGRFPKITLESARNLALKNLATIVEGSDPAGLSREAKEAMTVEDLGALYIERHAKPYKRSWAEDERILIKDVYPYIGRVKGLAVRKRDILDLIDAKSDQGKLAQSRNVLATVRKMFNWAVENDYLETSPVVGVKSPGKISRRDRVLSNEEIKCVWDALPDANLNPVTCDVIRLLLLTGQRSGEVCGITMKEVNLENGLWTIPADRTKNGLAHYVPLSRMARSILRERWPSGPESQDHPIFAVINKSIEPNAISQGVRKCLQLFEERWTPHDLRRTVATGMADIGVLPHVIEASLNHISGFRSGVAGVYNRATYDREKRIAMDHWSEHLDSVVSGQTNNVVPLRWGE